MSTDKLGIAIFDDMTSGALIDSNGAKYSSNIKEDLKTDVFYICNMSKAEISYLGISEEQKGVLLPESLLSVKPYHVASELGYCSASVKEEAKLSNRMVNILEAVRQGFVSALHRAGISLEEVLENSNGSFLEKIYKKTMPPQFQGESWPGILLGDRNPEVHTWVKTGETLSKGGNEPRILSVNRSVFYNACLSYPVPTGTWEQGDPAATQTIILETMTDDHGVLVKGVMEPPETLSFVPSCTTVDDRNFYIAHEVASVDEEGGHIRIADWWSGPLETPSHPLEQHYVSSLGDSILLEMAHRSWRKQGNTGYWIACTERLMLHGISEALHNAGIKVLGYGSGRIRIESPTEKAARAQQDLVLKEFVEVMGLQIPIENSWDAEDIKLRFEMLSAPQRYAMCGGEFLKNLDIAIDKKDQVLIDELHAEAKQQLDDITAIMQS